FSSRRRHTRLVSDWSSDVCSSDLALRELASHFPVSVLNFPGGPTGAELAAAGVCRISHGPGGMGVALAALRREAEALLAGGAPGSEERRVGEGGRGGGGRG